MGSEINCATVLPRGWDWLNDNGKLSARCNLSSPWGAMISYTENDGIVVEMQKLPGSGTAIYHVLFPVITAMKKANGLSDECVVDFRLANTDR